MMLQVIGAKTFVEGGNRLAYVTYLPSAGPGTEARHQRRASTRPAALPLH